MLTIQENVLLAPYTGLKIGGPARFFVEAHSIEELQEALRFADEKRLPVVILGGGTNVLVSDNGFDGLVIKIQDTRYKIQDTRVVAGAGCTMGQVVAAAQKAGLTGLEWAVGLPGTVGGAVFGNAGCFGGETADVIENVALLCHSGHRAGIQDSWIPDQVRDDRGGNPSTSSGNNIFRVKTVDKSYLNFGYRFSKLKETGEIVLSATFKLKKGSPEEIATAMERIRQKSRERIAEQPLGSFTAGSTFKGISLTSNVKCQMSNVGADWRQGLNRADYLSAGWLLEQVGLKGYRVGNASFSSQHANFIINHGKATAVDVVKLIDTAKKKVQEKFGIVLEEEIQYIGFHI